MVTPKLGQSSGSSAHHPMHTRPTPDVLPTPGVFVNVARLLIWTVAVSAGVACKKPEPPPPPPSPDAPPILPSPEGSHYALGTRQPADPIVEAIVRKGLFPWVESLSGAATTIALDTTHHPTLSAAQWAAIRAGYPHPVLTIVEGTEPPGTLPDELIGALAPNLRIGDHLGLVRARTAAGDRWVAIVGRPAVELNPFPREYPVGATLEVTGSSLAQWVLVSPSGKRSSGSLPLTAPLGQAGEWWLEFQASPADSTQLMGVPIYVGIPTPKAPTIPVHDVGELPGPEELRDRALDALFDVRAAFDLPEFAWDATLASLAATPVQQVLAGTWDAGKGVQRLRGAGFIGGPAAQLTCTASSVEACVTSLAHHADTRAQLLDPGLRLVGVAGEVRTSGVTLVLNLSSE
jgi:hypothetical protein